MTTHATDPTCCEPMMKAAPQCHHCFVRQARDAARRCGLDEERTARLVEAVERELAAIPTETNPPVTASRIHALVRELSGDPDPYAGAKAEATEHALALDPHLRGLVEHAPDPLDTALRLAIAGNIIDLGVADSYDLEASIERVLAEPLTIDHSDRLRATLSSSETLLYLADNAGETVMDRLLIETIRAYHPTLEVTCVVKGGPAVNDATRADAVAAGLDDVCRIIDNGAATLGDIPGQLSAEVERLIAESPVIIAKGMANYEALNGSRNGLFFLLQTKCAVVSQHLGVAEKSLLILEDGPRT